MVGAGAREGFGGGWGGRAHQATETRSPSFAFSAVASTPALWSAALSLSSSESSTVVGEPSSVGGVCSSAAWTGVLVASVIAVLVVLVVVVVLVAVPVAGKVAGLWGRLF